MRRAFGLTPELPRPSVIIGRPRMPRLTNQQSEELCRIGAIPTDRCCWFVQAVEGCVAAYRRERARKSAAAVGAELGSIEKCVWRALGLIDRKTWRRGEFRKILEDISARLRNLSPAAKEYLELRNLRIRRDVFLEALSDSSDLDVLIDPVCFADRDHQVLALHDLLGALAAPVARKQERGHPRRDLERALYHFVAAAYSRATGRAASDSSTKFMAVCLEIKRIHQLDHWNPESLARSARPPKGAAEIIGARRRSASFALVSSN
jgi:hypothetical protein